MTRSRSVGAGIVLSVALAGCSSGGSPVVTAPRVTSTSPSPSHGQIAVVQVREPVGLARFGNAVWVVSARTGTVRPLDLAGRPVKVGTTPLRAVSDGRLLWVSVFGSNRVVAVNPRSRRVVRRVEVPGQPEGLAVANGSVWVVRQAARVLTEISPAGVLVRSFAAGVEPRLVAAGAGALYVSDFGGGRLVRVDPARGAVTTSGKVCDGPQGIAVTSTAVWVACTPAGVVIAVDPKTLTVLGKVAVPGEPDAIRVQGSRVYVAATDGPALVEVTNKPRHPAVVRRTALGVDPPLGDRANVDLVLVNGRAYVSSPNGDRVVASPLS